MPPRSHELFQWAWHHFRPPAKAENYLPVLEILGNHEGEAVADARRAVSEEVHKLDLGIGLGKRKGKPADIFRDRIDVWRFTGSLFEPGLFDDRIQLTDLGRSLLDGIAPFEEAMARQTLRLAFPRVVRIRESSMLPNAIAQLNEALSIGPGINVLRAWATATGHLRILEETNPITGDEAAKFLSGAATMAQIPERAEALRSERIGVPPGYPEPEAGPRRQASEIKHWLTVNGALAPIDEHAIALDPSDRYFSFRSGSADEMMRWSYWWGSWLPAAPPLNNP